MWFKALADIRIADTSYIDALTSGAGSMKLLQIDFQTRLELFGEVFQILLFNDGHDQEKESITRGG